MVKFLLTIDDKVWANFKKNATHDKTLNQAVVDLIIKAIKSENK